VAIVTMQLNEINGVDKKENEALDEDNNYSRWLYNREFRVTYRDTLIASERLTDGVLVPKGTRGDSIFVSFEKGFAEGNGFKIRDEILFNVQGRPITTYIGSFREVKFNQVSTNFLVLFPKGVLEEAPKFHVIITKTTTDKQAATMQADMVREFPNISIINLGTIVATLEEILGKKIVCGNLDITFYRDDFRRRERPLIPSITNIDFSIENKKVVLIDDVLYTGRTIRSGLDALLTFGRPSKVELLVIIDRRFSRDLPIQADYTGKAIDTLISERVSVEWKETEGEDKVVLFTKESNE
jgi:pyrimidine operon attenuation protein/uracil phosphoribosyltransferase